MYLRAAFICGLYVFEGRVYLWVVLEGRVYLRAAFICGPRVIRGPRLFVGCMYLYLRAAFICGPRII